MILDSKKIDSTILSLYGCEDTGNEIVINCYDDADLGKGLKFSKAIDHLSNKQYIYRDRNMVTLEELRPYPLGIHRCSDERDVLYIFSNEIDLFTVAQATNFKYQNMIALVNRLDDYTALSRVYDFIHEFKRVVLISTADQQKWLHEANKRLKTDDTEVKTVYMGFWQGCKSINDFFVKFGEEETEQMIAKMFSDLEEITVPGVVDISTVKAEDKTRIKRYFTMVDMVDAKIGGMEGGSVWLLTGKAGNGKSELSKQLSLAVVQQGGSVFYYSGEETKERFLASLQCKMVDAERIVKTPRKLYGGKVSEYDFDYTANAEDAYKINKWLKGKYFVYDESFGKNVVAELKEKIELLHKEKGVNVFIIDNIMKLTVNVPQHMLNTVQAEIMDMLVEFANNYDTCVILVAHPHKTEKDDLENENISGTLNMVNLASVVMSVRRTTAAEREKMEKANKPVRNSLIRCTKNRRNGELFEVGADFDLVNKIFTINGQRPIYSWNKENVRKEAEEYIFPF